MKQSPGNKAYCFFFFGERPVKIKGKKQFSGKESSDRRLKTEGHLSLKGTQCPFRFPYNLFCLFLLLLVVVLRALERGNMILDWPCGARTLYVSDFTFDVLPKLWSFRSRWFWEDATWIRGSSCRIVRVGCTCSVRQHLYLRVKEDNFTKEKYVNTAKEGFASSSFNVGSISAALSCLVYPPGQRLLIKPTFNETLAEMQM